MGSTFLGVTIGLGIAAYFAVFQADTLNRWMSMVAATGVVPQQVEETEAAAPAPLPVPVEKPVVVAEPVPAVPPTQEDFLSQQWADFNTRAWLLKPVGEYRWRDCFTRSAATYNLPEPLLLAVARGESDFDATARSSKGAIGLMQILWPDTGRHLGINSEAELYDPCTNIDAGARYLAEMRDRFDNDLHKAVAAYNYGPGRIAKGTMPEGARWYSQYIYQHLQQVLGRPHFTTSDLAGRPVVKHKGGHVVLVTFNKVYRARDFVTFLDAQVPGLELAHRSEQLGQHEVVLLYDNDTERESALNAIRKAGILQHPGREHI